MTGVESICCPESLLMLEERGRKNGGPIEEVVAVGLTVKDTSVDSWMVIEGDGGKKEVGGRGDNKSGLDCEDILLEVANSKGSLDVTAIKSIKSEDSIDLLAVLDEGEGWREEKRILETDRAATSLLAIGSRITSVDIGEGIREGEGGKWDIAKV